MKTEPISIVIMLYSVFGLIALIFFMFGALSSLEDLAQYKNLYELNQSGHSAKIVNGKCMVKNMNRTIQCDLLLEKN